MWVKWRAPKTPGTLKNITSIFGVPLPKNYLAFMQKCNGGEGIAGNDAWLRLYPLEELEKATKDYATQEILPNHCLLGTDGVVRCLEWTNLGTTLRLRNHGEENTIVTIGFYEGINELFLKVSK